MPIAFPLKQYRNPVFVETGTFHGDGIWRALTTGFKKIYSIEISQEYYETAVFRFAKEIKAGRVEIFCGNSTDIIQSIIAKENKQITFWLDAHSMPHNIEAKNEGKEKSLACPLYEELVLIAQHPLKTHTIMIDDVRLLDDPLAWGGHNISLKGVQECLKKINPHYRIVFENGFKKKDVMIAYTHRNLILKWEEVLRNQIRRIYKQIC